MRKPENTDPGGARKRRVARAVLAASVVALLCSMVFGSVSALGQTAPAPVDVREFLETPQAVQGDGGHPLGFKLSPPLDYPKTPVAPSLLGSVPLGASADISSQIPPVGNQGAQGSCVAWATSYYYKSWSEKQEHGWSLTDTKHQFSPSFMYNQINDGQDYGSNFYDAFSLLQTRGDVDIAEFPYNQSNYTNQPSAVQLQAAKPFRIPSGWTTFFNRGGNGPFNPPNDITNAKGWLASGKPLVMGIPIYRDFPDDYGNPDRAYYDYNGSATMAGGHGVCIVGYDDNAYPSGVDADHRGGFKMVNSWGSSWNGGGYVYLSYDFVKRFVWEAWTMGDLSPDSPAISSLSRTSGNVGDSVEINGSNFGGLRRSARVTFNGVNAAGLTWTNEKVTATVPAGASSGPVAVSDWEGAASNAVQFTVGGGASGPSVTSVSPTEAQNTGTATLTVSGTGFTSGSTLKLQKSGSAAIEATDVTCVSASRVDGTVDLNGAAEGDWDVVLTVPGGGSSALSSAFRVTAPGPGTGDTYEPNDSVDVAYGPLQRGNSYVSFMWNADDVDYYSVSVPAGAESLTAYIRTVPSGCDYDLYVYDSALNEIAYSANSGNDDEAAVVDSPSVGTYFLMVIPYGGASSQSNPYRVSFDLAFRPTITGMTPTSGIKQTRITITGTSFGATRGGSYVSFGSTRLAATDYFAWSDTSISCRVPAVGGKPAVRVNAQGAASNAAYFYVTPRISTVNPTAGRRGAVVTIYGQGFGGWASGQSLVYFGSTRGTQYLQWSNGTIRVRVPSVARGTMTLKVKTAGGTSTAKTFRVF